MIVPPKSLFSGSHNASIVGSLYCSISFYSSDRNDYFNTDFYCIKNIYKIREQNDKKLFKNKIFQWFQCFFLEAASNANHHNKKTQAPQYWRMKVEEVDPCWLVMMIPW